MNNEDNVIEARGLNRNSNDIILPAGSLLAADECVITKDNIISRRRGFKKCNTGLPASIPEQMFVSSNSLFVHASNNLYVKDANCNYNLLSGFTPSIGRPTAIFFLNNILYVSTTNLLGQPYIIITINLNSGYVGNLGSFTVPVANDITAIWADSSYLYYCERGFCISRYNFATAITSYSWAGIYNNNGYADGAVGVAQFETTLGLCGNGTYIFVFDAGNACVRQIDVAGLTVSTLAGDPLNPGFQNGVGVNARFETLPGGVWCDNTHVYVVDVGNDAIRKIEIATGTVTTLTVASSFTSGITGDSGNFLYTGGGTNSVISQVNKTTGAITGYAGSVFSGYADGPKSTARFAAPAPFWNNQFTYGGGNIYVADTGNYLVRKIDPVNVSTIAGVPGSSSISYGYAIPPLVGPT